jgi:hypothetical protein
LQYVDVLFFIEFVQQKMGLLIVIEF